MRNSGDNEKS